MWCFLSLSTDLSTGDTSRLPIRMELTSGWRGRALESHLDCCCKGTTGWGFPISGGHRTHVPSRRAESTGILLNSHSQSRLCALGSRQHSETVVENECLLLTFCCLASKLFHCIMSQCKINLQSKHEISFQTSWNLGQAVLPQ